MLVDAFGDRKLDEITSADVERFRDSLTERKARATCNRYRDLLSGMFRRAIRHGTLTATNPVKRVSKFKENNERVTFLTGAEEAALLEALPPEYRPLFLVSVNTGLRWPEQAGLRWQDVDFFTGIITVPRSKHGHAQRYAHLAPGHLSAAVERLVPAPAEAPGGAEELSRNYPDASAPTEIAQTATP